MRFLPRNNLIHILFLLPFFLKLEVFAHEGGHGYLQENDSQKTWKLKDGREFQGSFLYAGEQEVILEKNNGQTCRIPIHQLVAEDQKIVYNNRKRLTSINADFEKIYEPETASPKEMAITAEKRILLIGLTCILFLGVWSITGIFKPKGYDSDKKVPLILSLILAFLFIGFACRKEGSTTVSIAIPKTSTSFLESVFAPFKPAIATRFDNTNFYVESNGIPAHNMMVGITSWQQQVPIPQNYIGANSWSIPLQPAYAAVPMSTKSNFMKGAVAIAVNGIPIFNALNNRGEDAFAIGELDNWGGHCGRADDYHYHAAPMHLAGNNANLPLAFALDGFAVYGNNEPDGTTMRSLDTCHGHTSTDGGYHYHGTNTYPYVIGAMRGVVRTDPATPAPENQILPQAFASPIRPALTALKGASIVSFTSTGPRGYKLGYLINGKPGSVEYSWDAMNKYTFIFTDTAGKVNTQTYQR